MKIPNFSFLIIFKQNSLCKLSSIFFLMKDPLVTFETTSKDKPMVRDINNYKWNIGNVRLKCAQLECEPVFLPQTWLELI